jgi:regulator of replication initiation timing
MPDDSCRLAKVEQQIETLEKDLTDLNEKLDKIIKAIEEMKTEQSRYKGFLGGIVFTIGALYSFLTWWTSK